MAKESLKYFVGEKIRYNLAAKCMSFKTNFMCNVLRRKNCEKALREPCQRFGPDINSRAMLSEIINMGGCIIQFGFVLG